MVRSINSELRGIEKVYVEKYGDYLPSYKSSEWTWSFNNTAITINELIYYKDRIVPKAGGENMRAIENRFEVKTEAIFKEITILYQDKHQMSKVEAYNAVVDSEKAHMDSIYRAQHAQRRDSIQKINDSAQAHKKKNVIDNI